MMPKSSTILDTCGFRSVNALLLHIAADPNVLHKGCSFIVDFEAFLADPHSGSGISFKSYTAIYDDAVKLASVMGQRHGVKKRVIMCYSDSQRDQIKLFWSCVFAGAIPCILPKLAYDEEQRTAYLRHLATVLVSDTKPSLLPLTIASDDLRHMLDCCPECETISIRDLELATSPVEHDKRALLSEAQIDRWDEVLSLHLTSGSTGFPKAVAITHGNALSASAGKAAMHNSTPETRFLNWLSMDHAAGLVEFHIWPMLARTNQVHISSHTVLSDPLSFLKALSHAQIDHAFAPMFFLSALLRALKKSTPEDLDGVRLKQGLRIVSGGEAVNTATATELVREYLVQLGASDNVIIPAFGMSETCAGFCFNSFFPEHDLASSRPFGAHGLRNPGTDVRILSFSAPFLPQPPGAPGEIQLRGPNVFKKYWNNPSATAKCLTPDGWFRTGDSGYLTADPDSGYMDRTDDDGRLLVVLGRDRDSLVIHDKKYALEELLRHIQDAGIEGLDPMWCTVFAIDPENASKGFVLLFRPTYNPIDGGTQHGRTIRQIYQSCIDWSPLRPSTILAIQEEQFVPKTTLGKLSMFKMRQTYLAGKFAAEEKSQCSVLKEVGFLVGDK